MTSSSPQDESADASFGRLLMTPSRFWAILSGEKVTEQEVAYIQSKPQLRFQAYEVLSQRQDARASWFKMDDSTPK